MNNSSFPVVFRRQLRFWTFHCFLNALPSFCIALCEGLILSFRLFTISLFAVMFLQARDRKKFFALANSRGRDDG